jgi:hypothetical protein
MKGTHQKSISGYFQQSGSNPFFNKYFVAWHENQSSLLISPLKV